MNAARLDLKAIGHLADRYRADLAAAQENLDTLVDEVIAARQDGATVNISTVAKVTGISRATLHRRILERSEKGSR